MQAAFLRILARQSGLSVEGAVTDRAGRQGIAVSAEKTEDGIRTKKLILVLDPATGALLDTEEVALQPTSLPVEPPATIGYTIWLQTGYSLSVKQRP